MEGVDILLVCLLDGGQHLLQSAVPSLAVGVDEGDELPPCHTELVALLAEQNVPLALLEKSRLHEALLHQVLYPLD